MHQHALWNSRDITYRIYGEVFLNQDIVYMYISFARSVSKADRYNYGPFILATQIIDTLHCLYIAIIRMKSWYSELVNPHRSCPLANKAENIDCSESEHAECDVQKVPFPWGRLGRHLIHGSLGPHESTSLNRCSSFSTAHAHDQQTVRRTDHTTAETTDA